MNIENNDNERVWYVGLPPAPGIGHEEPWYFEPLPGQHPDVGPVVCDLGDGKVYIMDANGEVDREHPVGRWEQGMPPNFQPNMNGGRRRRRASRKGRKSRKGRRTQRR